MILTLFSILISNGIPTHVEGEPHILVTDSGAYACIDLDASGEPISAWSSIIMTDEHNLTNDVIIVITPNQYEGWECSDDNLVGLAEGEADGTLAEVWGVLGEIRRQRAHCPQTCGTGC